MSPHSTITRGLSSNRSLLEVVHVQTGTDSYCISLYHHSPNLPGKRKWSIISIDLNSIQDSAFGGEFPDMLCRHKKLNSIYRMNRILSILLFVACFKKQIKMW